MKNMAVWLAIGAAATLPLSASVRAETLDQACVQYGKVAAQVASDRDRGISFSSMMAKAKAELGNSPAFTEAKDLLEFMYHEPAGMHLTSDGAAAAMYADCVVRKEKTAAGGRVVRDQPGLAILLKDFKTFNGKPLLSLLADYGVKIESIEVTPAEYFKNPDDRPGDRVMLMAIARGPLKPMPCRLKKYLTSASLPLPEFIARVGEFPRIRPDEEDPLIYWAATGKCSTAYSY